MSVPTSPHLSWKENAGMISPHPILQLGQGNLEAVIWVNEPKKRENSEGKILMKNISQKLSNHIISVTFVPQSTTTFVKQPGQGDSYGLQPHTNSCSFIAVVLQVVLLTLSLWNAAVSLHPQLRSFLGLFSETYFVGTSSSLGAKCTCMGAESQLEWTGDWVLLDSY